MIKFVWNAWWGIKKETMLTPGAVCGFAYGSAIVHTVIFYNNT